MATKLYKKNCKRCDIELTLDNKWRDEALCVICGPVIKKKRDKKHAPKRRLTEKKWRECNPDKVAKYRQKEKEKGDYYRRQYGLAVDEVNDLLRTGCQVCGSSDNLRIDHCHNTGDVRGCLCHGCNVALGFVAEDSDRLRQLANYIDSRKGSRI
jgi:hypothetical protein